MEEIWKPVPSAPGWEASTLGRVRKLPTKYAMPMGGFKTISVDATFGHISGKDQRHKISANGRTARVAVLVCEAFHGSRPPKQDCMHLNEDKHDNRPQNLAWGTRSENQKAPKLQAARRERLIVNNPRRKLTAKDAANIVAESSYLATRDLAFKYGVSTNHIRSIVRGDYRHLL